MELNLLIPIIVIVSVVAGFLLARYLRENRLQDYPCLDEVVLRLDPTKEPKITAEPDPARIQFGGSVNWIIKAEPRDQVDIVFDKEEGPFRPSEGNPANPKRGQYNNHQGVSLISSNASDKENKWKYTVKWERNGKEYEEDPSVWIRR